MRACTGKHARTKKNLKSYSLESGEEEELIVLVSVVDGVVVAVLVVLLLEKPDCV